MRQDLLLQICVEIHREHPNVFERPNMHIKKSNLRANKNSRGYGVKWIKKQPQISPSVIDKSCSAIIHLGFSCRVTAWEPHADKGSFAFVRTRRST